MSRFDQFHDEDPEPTTSPRSRGWAQDVLQSLRVVVSLVGLVIAIVGVVWIFSLSSTLLATLEDPARLEPTVSAVADLIGGESLTVATDQGEYRVDRLVALLVLVLALGIAVRVVLSLLVAGARMVSFAAGDQEVKELLQSTLREIAAAGKQARAQ